MSTLSPPKKPPSNPPKANQVTDQTSPQRPGVLKITLGLDGEVCPAADTPEAFDTLIRQTLGSSDRHTAMSLLTQVLASYPGVDLDNKVSSVAIMNILTPLLHAIGPRDELEAMLACQMIAAHNLTMECFRRAGQPGLLMVAVDSNINRGTKLARTFVAQLEALNKHRGKGQQKITVEHVHVAEGGQAIVGIVNQDKQEK